MTAKLICSSASQADKVEETRIKGKPAEKPRKIMPSTRGWT
jgi:hypothetical protein